MKTFRRALTILLALALLCGLLAAAAFAKDLEPCYHCGTTGHFHCDICNNTGVVTCDGCGGAGGSVCEGEPGKGCDGGYYTCPSCNGDGLARPIPADGVTSPCGNCGGSGKLRCVVCHTVPGWNVCDRCGGTGEYECQSHDCQASKAVGWLCSYCMGAGYMLTNFWPGENDGVQNLPQPGDKIWVDGKSTTYGGGPAATAAPQDPDQTPGGFGQPSDDASAPGDGTAQEPDGPGPGEPPPDEQPPAEELIWRVDFGMGSWEYEGRHTVASIDGRTVSGVVELREDTVIRLEGFDQDIMQACVTADDGFFAVLIPNDEGEVSLGRHTPGDCVIPERVHFSVGIVWYSGTEDGGENAISPPDDRHTDYAIPTGDGASVEALVEVGRMSDEEQRYYAGLSDGELAALLADLRDIVLTADPGRMEDGTEELLNALAAQNGFDSLEDGRLYPIAFEGHRDIGFPVRVTVTLNEGELEGGSDLYVYHITESGEIEPLGRADYYTTWPDGSVERISFFTDGFSSFFTAAKELDLSGQASSQGGDAPAPYGIIVAAALAVVIIGVLVFMLARKKRA